MYASRFRSRMLKRSHKHQLLYAREGDDDAWPKCHEEARCYYCSASCCTVPSPGTSRSQSLTLRPVAKYPYLLGTAPSGQSLKPFHVLEQFKRRHSSSQIYFGHTVRQGQDQEQGKKRIPSLYTKSIQ